MPLYEYQCKQCQHRFEKIQSFSAPEEKVCPECGGEVERLISAPAIQFKGAGWYVNDYAGRGKAHSASASDGGSKEGGSKEGSSKEGGKDAAAKSANSDSGSKSGAGAASSSDSGSSTASSSSGSSTKSSD